MVTAITQKRANTFPLERLRRKVEFGLQPALERYAVKAITGGTDALGEVSCLLREDGMTVAGAGAHSDIVMASALALVNALNRLKGRTAMPLKPTMDVP